MANKYGPVADVIYITPNLTEPATLKADTGSESKLDQPAGGQLGYWDAVPAGRSTQLRAAAERPGSAAGSGTDPIQATPQYNDDYYYSTGEMIAPRPAGVDE